MCVCVGGGDTAVTVAQLIVCVCVCGGGDTAVCGTRGGGGVTLQ